MKPKFISQRLSTDSTKTVMMSPKEFLELSIPKKNGRYHEPAYDQASLRRLEGRITKQLTIDPPEFEVEADTGRIIDHSGRHRAFTALKMGVKKIPVVLRYVGYERTPGFEIKKTKVSLSKIPTYYDLKPEIKRRKYEIERMVE